MNTVKVTINGIQFEAEPNTTILKVASANGISIPTFCYHPNLSIAANCRMCLVEVEGAPKLLPACQTEIRDGMKIWTESEKVKSWRKQNLEFILLHHPIDCPICDAAGDCKLQNFYNEYDWEKSRLWSFTDKLHKSKRKILGPNVIYDAERCILCTLCIRFCKEIYGQHLLDSRNRGNRREIIVAEGETLDFPYSLMLTEICPVGALTNRHFRFKKRCWFLSSSPGICPGCATGCATIVDHDEGIIFRLRPRQDIEVNGPWLCDDGVLAGELHNTERISSPAILVNGEQKPVSMEMAIQKAGEILKQTPSEKIGVVLSAGCTCEENSALMNAREALNITGPIFIEGRPEGEEDNILRNKDKNPNKRGAKLVAQGKETLERKDLIELVNAGKIDVLLCLGSDGPDKDDFHRNASIISLSSRRGNLSNNASVVFPAPSYAETKGTYINFKGMERKFDISIKSWGSYKPPLQVWETLNILFEKTGITAKKFSGDNLWVSAR